MNNYTKNGKKSKQKMRQIEILLIIFIISLFFLSSYASAYKIDNYTIEINYLSIDETNPEFLYISTNTHYQFGKETAKRFPILFSVLLKLSGEISSEEIQDTLNVIENMDENFLSELTGFADGLRINLVQAVHLLNTLYLYLPDMNCTTSLSTRLATSDGASTFLTQNIDTKSIWRPIYKNVYVKKLWVTKTSNESLRYIHFGIPLAFRLLKNYGTS